MQRSNISSDNLESSFNKLKISQKRVNFILPDGQNTRRTNNTRYICSANCTSGARCRRQAKYPLFVPAAWDTLHTTQNGQVFCFQHQETNTRKGLESGIPAERFVRTDIADSFDDTLKKKIKK